MKTGNKATGLYFFAMRGSPFFNKETALVCFQFQRDGKVAVDIDRLILWVRGATLSWETSLIVKVSMQCSQYQWTLFQIQISCLLSFISFLHQLLCGTFFAWLVLFSLVPFDVGLLYVSIAVACSWFSQEYTSHHGSCFTASLKSSSTKFWKFFSWHT